MVYQFNSMKLYKLPLILILITIGCSFSSYREQTFKRDLATINKINEGYKNHSKENPFQVILPDSFKYRSDIVAAFVGFNTKENLQLPVSYQEIVNDKVANDFYRYHHDQMKNLESRYDSAIYLGQMLTLLISRDKVLKYADNSKNNDYDEFENFSFFIHDEKSGGVDVEVMRILYLLKKQ